MFKHDPCQPHALGRLVGFKHGRDGRDLLVELASVDLQFIPVLSIALIPTARMVGSRIWLPAAIATAAIFHFNFADYVERTLFLKNLAIVSLATSWPIGRYLDDALLEPSVPRTAT